MTNQEPSPFQPSNDGFSPTFTDALQGDVSFEAGRLKLPPEREFQLLAYQEQLKKADPEQVRELLIEAVKLNMGMRTMFGELARNSMKAEFETAAQHSDEKAKGGFAIAILTVWAVLATLVAVLATLS